jgi:hypothetical protein
MPLHVAVAALAASPAAAATAAARNHHRRAGRRVLASPGGLTVFGGSAMHKSKSNDFGDFTNNTTITKTSTPTPKPVATTRATRAARIVAAASASPLHTAAPAHRGTRTIAPRASYRSGVAVRSSSSSNNSSGGGAVYKSNPVYPHHSLKGAWFQPRTSEVKTRFQSLPSNATCT